MRTIRQAGFTIPITMLMVSVLMVLSTAIVAMTVASFRDASRMRNRAEILNVSEIGLKLAIAEIMPGLGLLPNTYWSYATKSNDVNASSSVSTVAQPIAGSKDRPDLPHDVQLFANTRNWSPFADWTQWDSTKTYAENHANLLWSKGWWMVPRTLDYDDAYYNEDANGVRLDGSSNVYKDQLGKPNEWTYKNPTKDESSKLAFPVRLGRSSEPVRNLYWYWLTEIEPNTPTNTQLRSRGLTDPYWVNSPPRLGPPHDGHPRAQRDVGIGAWQNREEYADRITSAQVTYDDDPFKPMAEKTKFSLQEDRYNFLNTPVLKKIYTVDHRGTMIRVAVYCRMILREYFIDPVPTKPAYPANFLTHMRTGTSGGGPNVVFYLVAVNESTPQQRGVRVQQAIYVPMGPANPQDVDATLADLSIDKRFADDDGRMVPGTLDLVMDKKLLAGATISGRILPASGDLSYRVPTNQPYTNNPFDANAKKNLNSRHPHWVYLIEGNGLGPEIGVYEDGGDYLSTNSALIWKVPGTNNWRRTPFRYPDGTARIVGAEKSGPDLGNGATPSAFADVFGAFQIGPNTDLAVFPEPDKPLQGGETGWQGPGMHPWGGPNATRASMSYIVTTELQIPKQENSNARYSRSVTATRSVGIIAPSPDP